MVKAARNRRSVRDTAALLGVSPSTVVRRCREPVGQESVPKPPRSTPPSPEVALRREIVSAIVEAEYGKQKSNAADICRKLLADYDIDVSRSTVYRDLEAKGYTLKMRPKCPWMEDQEKKDARKEFCEREDINALAAANLVAFSDEKIFRAGSQFRGQYCCAFILREHGTSAAVDAPPQQSTPPTEATRS